MATRRGKGRGPKVTPRTGGQFAMDLVPQTKAPPKTLTYAEWRKTLGPSAKVPVKPVPTVPYIRPPFSSGQTPSNAAGVAEKTGKTQVNWKFATPDQSIPRGAQVAPVSETTGRKVVPIMDSASVNSSSTSGSQARIGTPKWEFPWDKPKIKLGSVLGAPAAGAEALLYSESLNQGEFDGEEGQEWINQNRPEGWSSSTMAVEADIMSRVAIDSTANIKAVQVAEEKVKMLTEAGASDSLINQAKGELASAKGTGTTDHFKEYESEVEADLAQTQTMIDLKIKQFYSAGNRNVDALLKATGLLDKKDALENKLADISLINNGNKVQQDEEAASVMKMAHGMDPTKLMPQLGSQDKTTIKKEGDSALDKFFDGTVKTLKGAMTLAGEGLGSLFAQKPIQQALIYYMGARLMGYSGSGSGMAAGQVLINGWDNQAAADLVTSKAQDKAIADSAIDQTKTVEMWDKKTKQIITGYSSKDGKSFYQVTKGGLSEKPINPAASGLVTYKSGSHKTFDEINKDILDSTNKTTNYFIKTLNSNEDYSDSDLAALNQTFGNGRAARDVLEVVTREMQEAGTDYDNAAFTAMFQNMLTTTMEKQAKGLRKGDYGEETASMVGEWREMQLKNNLTREGTIPNFIYGKATEWGDKGVTKYEKGFDASGQAKGMLETKINSLRNYWVKSAVTNGATTQEANEKITTTRVAQELGRLFQNTVMLDPIARTYWTDQAGDRSNAFMSWMQSNDTSNINHEHQYLGLNSSKVRDLAVDIDFDKKFNMK